jgi:hypothetical protein
LGITTGAISGATGDDFVINGGAGTISYGGTITNSSGHSVNVQNKTAGTVTFSGAITDTSGSTGILVNSNTGATIDFTGGLSLTTTTNAAFTATGGGGTVNSITNNAVSLKTTGTNAIIVANSGGNSASRTHTNFIISGNGRTAALGGSAPGALGSSSIGTVILIGNNGFSTMTGTVDSNVITASHTPNLGGGNGIAGGNGVAGAGNAWTPDLTLTVTNNTISGTDGNGILLASRGGTGTARLKVADNTAAAPVNAGGVAAQGIRVDAGNAKSANDSVFLNIRGNTSAGSNGASGIGVRKQGTVSTTNVFGIFDAPGDPTTLRANPHQDSG